MSARVSPSCIATPRCQSHACSAGGGSGASAGVQLRHMWMRGSANPGRQSLARSLGDLILLLGPIATVRTLTERSLGAFGAAQWRELRLPPPGDTA